MNQPSEQLTSCYNIVIDHDQPLSPKELRESVFKWSDGRCSMQEINGRRVVVFQGRDRQTILLCKCVTYLGNPHPVFKKRIQIPRDWLAYSRQVLAMGYDVRFIGVYHYDGFIVFADFKKETYLEHVCNNSAAHIYINDLFQGATNDVFRKTDQNGNQIVCVSCHRFAAYLDGWQPDNSLVEMFARFNHGYSFGQWMTAIDAISEMHQKHWSQWQQTEWAGWFLEYKFSQYAQQPAVSPYIRYTALENKGHREGSFDFDLWFPLHQFYGDLKASDVTKSETPGNDQGAFIECLNRYNKFWYVVYEHETKKDSDCGYEATKWRNHYVWDNEEKHTREFDEMSYSGRMKHSVRFVRMFILELNRINFHEALSSFNQGHQPDGGPRKPKFLINKKNIDNFVIYRYAHTDDKV